MRCKVVKNKVAPPFKTAEFDLLYGKGICKTNEIIDLGVTLGVIEKSGAWFAYDGQRLGQGKDKARIAIESDPSLLAELEEKIRALLDRLDLEEEMELEEDFDLREFEEDTL